MPPLVPPWFSEGNFPPSWCVILDPFLSHMPCLINAYFPLFLLPQRLSNHSRGCYHPLLSGMHNTFLKILLFSLLFHYCIALHTAAKAIILKATPMGSQEQESQGELCFITCPFGISSKIRNKTRMPTFATFIQHSIGSPSHSNLTRKRNKESKLERKKYNCHCLQMAWYYT